jgi:hypothetical protein
MTTTTEHLEESQPASQNWAQKEFGDFDAGDTRRTRRLVLGLESMLENVGRSVPEATGCWSQCKAFYRLLERDEIT